ncbi:MAG: hypothetical protein WCO78_03675 [Candidatus Roizmanbacteria bacterium]
MPRREASIMHEKMDRSEALKRIWAMAVIAITGTVFTGCARNESPPTYGEVPGFTPTETLGVGGVNIKNGTGHHVNSEGFEALIAVIRSAQKKSRSINEYTLELNPDMSPKTKPEGTPIYTSNSYIARIEPVNTPKTIYLLPDEKWQGMNVNGLASRDLVAAKANNGFTLHAYLKGQENTGSTLASYAYVHLGSDVASGYEGQGLTGIDTVRPLVTELCQVNSLGYTGNKPNPNAQEAFCNGFSEMWDASRHGFAYDKYTSRHNQLNQSRRDLNRRLLDGKVIETVQYDQAMYEAMQNIPPLFK